MPAQHQIEYCHVDTKTGEILEGPMALPQNWGSVAGFCNLRGKDLVKYNWYPVRDDGVVATGEEYVLMFLQEHGVVIKAPIGNRIFRGGQRYAIIQLYKMFEFFTTLAFFSPVLGKVYKFPNAPCEHVHRQNCLMAKEDYSCLAETQDRKWVRVTVPHKDIPSLMKDAVAVHNQQLEKMDAAIEDVKSCSQAELLALLDTNFADYYG